jgi:LysM repeat protein
MHSLYRFKRFFPMAISLLFLTFLLRPAPAATQSPIDEIYRRVNDLRGSYGLPPFSYNAQLAAAAQEQSVWLSLNGIYVHNHGGSTPQTRANAAGYQGYVVENIVGGTGLTPAEAVLWWINSPVHLNTLLSSRHTEVGIGFATGLDQNFYTLVAGRPTDAPLPPGNSGSGESDQTGAIYVAPIILSAPREDGAIVHEVQEGQTLWALAARYDAELADLYLFNNLGEGDFVRPGDEIFIRLPDGAEPPPTPTPRTTHRVREGESLWTIAALYDVELRDLLYYNGLGADDYIQPGDELKVRFEGLEPPPTPTPVVEHRVAAGDTLWGIAARYDLTVEELQAYNGLAPGAILQPDQMLRVLPPPTATPAPTATPVPTSPPATPVPTAAIEAAVAPLPSPSPTAVAPSPTATVDADPAVGEEEGGPSMVLGAVLLVALLGVGAIILRRT